MKRILPAYPLFVIDPNFSIWSNEDNLTNNSTMFWTDEKVETYGLINYKGTTYCFLGSYKGAEKLLQKKVEITAFSTDYSFECEDFILNLSFVSPRIPNDLEILSLPACYVDYSIIEKKDKAENFSIALVFGENYIVHSDNQSGAVMGGVLPFKDFESGFITLKRNLYMSNSNDAVSPDWGDLYLSSDESFFVTESALKNYVKSGECKYIRKEEESNYLMGINHSKSGFFTILYDDKLSIFYFGNWLKGYYFRKGKTFKNALNDAYKNHSLIEEKCKLFDEKLKGDCSYYGKDYYTLCCASLRQSVGAHKLVEDENGNLLFLSKECDSNGCIGTADVSYPSMPLYLVYNPELVNGMIRGIYRFAKMDVWKYDFAPHDIGTYPFCVGQVYGVNNSDDKYNCGMVTIEGNKKITHTMLFERPSGSDIYLYNMQMPVEECGNMLIMTASAYLAGGKKDIIEENFSLMKNWVTYLEKYGLKPENQLCTDDFAGHLANNINLAIKALVGIESFSIICEAKGEKELCEIYRKKAKDFSLKLKKEIGNVDIIPLAYGKKDSYSLKYNILFDKLFGFELIGQKICERETDYYIEKCNEFGVPLDERATYTKSDWILWCSALTDSKEKAKKLFMPVVNYLEKTPTRVVFSDWYETKSGKYIHFKNRTVQGGIFALILKESKILNKNMMRRQK